MDYLLLICIMILIDASNVALGEKDGKGTVAKTHRANGSSTSRGTTNHRNNKSDFEELLKESSKKTENNGKSFLTSDSLLVGVPLEVVSNHRPIPAARGERTVTKVGLINRDSESKPPIVIYEADQSGSSPQISTYNSNQKANSDPSSFGRRNPGPQQGLRNAGSQVNRQVDEDAILDALFSGLNSQLNGATSNRGTQFTLGGPENSFHGLDRKENLSDPTSLFFGLFGDDIDSILDDDYYGRVIREGSVARDRELNVQAANIDSSSDANAGAPPGGTIPLSATNVQNDPNSNVRIGSGRVFHVPNGGSGTNPRTQFRVIPDADSREDIFESSVELRRPLGRTAGSLNRQNNRRYYDSAQRRYNLQQQRLLRRKRPNNQAYYSYGYQVNNHETRHSHNEQREGNRVEGSYQVDLPNGLRQIVRYYADETGYHPTVTYEPIANFYNTQKIVNDPFFSSTKLDVKTSRPDLADSEPSASVTSSNYKAISFPDWEPPRRKFYTRVTPSGPSRTHTASTSSGSAGTYTVSTTPSYESSTIEDNVNKGKEMKTTISPTLLIDPKYIRKSSRPVDTNVTVQVGVHGRTE